MVVVVGVVGVVDLEVVENNHLADNLEDVGGVHDERILKEAEAAHDDNHQVEVDDMIQAEVDHDNHGEDFGRVEAHVCSLHSVDGKDHGRFHGFDEENVWNRILSHHGEDLLLSPVL